MARIRGTKGEDRIDDKKKNDKIKALAGDDLILMKDGGEDTVNGGPGSDSISYWESETKLTINMRKGRAKDGDGNVDTLKKIENADGSGHDDKIFAAKLDWSWVGGRAGDDNLIGNKFGNVFNGGSGDDTINGKGGWNIVQYSDDGADHEGKIKKGVVVNLVKGTAKDGWGDRDTLKNIAEVRGTQRKDKMIGNEFGNVLRGDDGKDVLKGGRAVSEDSSNNWDQLFGGNGKDTLILVNGEASGDAGNDRISGLKNKAGNLDLEWSGAVYREADQGIVANLTGMTIAGLAGGNAADGFRVKDGLGGVDLISKLKFVVDSAHNDVFHVDAGWTNSYGNFINIELTAGDDTAVFHGFVGVARISYAQAGGAILADMQTATATDRFTGDSHVGDDSFAGANQLRGSSFADHILGSLGDDARIRGNDGDDLIEGRSGNDRLEGEGGNDVLVGGAGADTLTGGGGADTFRFLDASDSAPSGGVDVIGDFSQLDGDRIDIGAIVDAFSFVGKGQFTGKADEVRYQQDAQNTYVYADLDGDGVADFVVTVAGKVDLVQQEFVV